VTIHTGRPTAAPSTSRATSTTLATSVAKKVTDSATNASLDSPSSTCTSSRDSKLESNNTHMMPGVRLPGTGLIYTALRKKGVGFFLYGESTQCVLGL
jgi:hypothetical protein